MQLKNCLYPKDLYKLLKHIKIVRNLRDNKIIRKPWLVYIKNISYV